MLNSPSLNINFLIQPLFRFQGRNLSNFYFGFLENWRHQNVVLRLTDLQGHHCTEPVIPKGTSAKPFPGEYKEDCALERNCQCVNEQPYQLGQPGGCSLPQPPRCLAQPCLALHCPVSILYRKLSYHTQILIINISSVHLWNVYVTRLCSINTCA